jgi:hypothetical protein
MLVPFASDRPLPGHAAAQARCNSEKLDHLVPALGETTSASSCTSVSEIMGEPSGFSTNASWNTTGAAWRAAPLAALAASIS